MDWATYMTWVINGRPENHGVVLVDIGYADKETITGHGRSNFTAVLNPVTEMQVRVYTDGHLELTFSQPTSQEGYSWEVWLNGEVVLTTSGGFYSQSSTVSGDRYQFAVASIKDDQYSEPWIVDFTKVGGIILQGALGDWNDIGTGTGATGTGMVHLSSFPWVSDEYVAYDNFLTTDPEFEKSIYNFGGIGDFRATNQIPDELNWKDLYWRGHTCNFYHGDEDWPRDDFWLIGSALISDFRMAGPTEYQFDLIDGAQSLNRNFQLGSIMSDNYVNYTFDAIATMENLPTFNFSAVPSVKQNMLVRARDYIETNKTIGNALRVLADSVNLYMSVSDKESDGSIRLLNKDKASLEVRTFKHTLLGDEIAEGEMIMAKTISAARKVVIELVDGTEVKASTTAATGELVETVTIKTMLVNEADAQIILQEYVEYYSVPHRVWQIGVLQVAGQFLIGDLVTVDHYLLQDTGVVTRIKSSPMTSFYTIDLEIV